MWVVALSHTEAAYTLYNGFFCGAWLLMEGLWRKGNYLPQFFVAYLWHVPPFLLVNGALTGSFTEQPVVWYNESETLGLRCLTIPLEDFSYSLLLFLMTVNYYEMFKELLPSQKEKRQV